MEPLMSYARFGSDGSDVYVYSTGYSLICCRCVLYAAPTTIECDTHREMLSHLARHKEAGHVVPPLAIQALKHEYETGLAHFGRDFNVREYSRLLDDGVDRFANTRKAISEYDARRTARNALYSNAKTIEDLEHAVSTNRTAVERVRSAFYKDTKDRNNPDQARLVHPDDPWLRSLVLRTNV